MRAPCGGWGWREVGTSKEAPGTAGPIEWGGPLAGDRTGVMVNQFMFIELLGRFETV